MGKFGTAASVRVRLYLEGILVENALASITVSGGVNSPASASLEMVPTNTAKHIMPGTWVHVFTTDPWDNNQKGDDTDFNLLFEGVVTGRSVRKESGGRALSIECMDASVFWTAAKQFWVNISTSNGEGLVDQMMIQTSGGYGRWGKSTKTEGYGYLASKLARIETGEEDRFIDTLVSVIDDIGNVNPYYTNARNRMRITDRIIRAPAGGTDKLFQMALMGEFIHGLAGMSSGQTNLIDIVNQLLGAIVHEWTSVPAPPYVDAEIFDRDVFGNIKRVRKTVKNRGPNEKTTVDLLSFHKATDKIIGSMIFKPHVYTLSPPTCNILFPNMYDSIGFAESFLDQTTRVTMRPQLPMVDKSITSQMVMHRPAEVEIFLSQLRDPKTNGMVARTADGFFGDGEGQAPNFNDYDWSTNEERIRGIVYNFMNLAPAPSTLTAGDQGKKASAEKRKGGIPKFLQNIASYEYFKSKFAARQSAVRGPFNPRVVPGFSMLILDDSEANMNMVAYLESVTHSIDADGSAMTSYSIKYPRLVEEVNYNEPKFANLYAEDGDSKGYLNSELARDAQGNFSFGKMWENDGQPPIPEWFDQSFRTLAGLDQLYKKWFGKESGVAQLRSFGGRLPSDSEAKATARTSAVLVGVDLGGIEDEIDALAKVYERHERITIAEAAKDLNAVFRASRDDRNEFEYVANYTDRSFTKITEAFKFIGAKSRSETDTKRFVGSTDPGFGYNGVSSSDAAPTDSTKFGTSFIGRMSGAFPKFDSIQHSGTASLNPEARAVASKKESDPSEFARYDGRPLMYDFENRIWLQSLANAKKDPLGEDFDEKSEVSDYYLVDEKNAVVGPKSKEEQAEAAMARLDAQKAAVAKERSDKAQGKHTSKSKKSPNMPANAQAPTGDALDEEPRNPLPQPLSERQVIKLRKAVVEAYLEELEKSRGFTG